MARTGKIYLTKRIRRNIEVNERVAKTGCKSRSNGKTELYVNPKLAKKLKTRQLKAQRKAKHYMQSKGER